MFRFLLDSFQRLIFRDRYKSFPLPPLEIAGSINENTYLISLCELSTTHLSEVCVIYEKSKLGLSEILLVST
jgi:hypothetical protein